MVLGINILLTCLGATRLLGLLGPQEQVYLIFLVLEPNKVRQRLVFMYLSCGIISPHTSGVQNLVIILNQD